jgi:RNA ligase (TIGR02306 family)
MTENITRKMATIRSIDGIQSIPGADSICAYQIGGWMIVDRISAYQLSELVIYCEIDSWIPTSIAPFLSKGKEPKSYEGISGERLRTIKLRKQVSQGLILPLSILSDKDASQFFSPGDNVSDLLGIIKYDPPLPACLRGSAKGNFPSFIPKTDEERCQNLVPEIEQWSIEKDLWEISEKLDGSSISIFHKDGEFGVCSRNLDLKETEGNSFWTIARKNFLIEKLITRNVNYALQGELIGEGIQGNPYKIKGQEFYLFNIWNIDEQRYLNAIERTLFAKENSIKHVPILDSLFCLEHSVNDLLELAEGKSELNTSTEREGIVLKRVKDGISFKAISNKHLLKEK